MKIRVIAHTASLYVTKIDFYLKVTKAVNVNGLYSRKFLHAS